MTKEFKPRGGGTPAPLAQARLHEMQREDWYCQQDSDTRDLLDRAFITGWASGVAWVDRGRPDKLYPRLSVKVRKALA